MNERIGTRPMRFEWFGDDLHLLTVVRAYAPYIGQALVAVEGVPVPELMERFRRLISHETEAWLCTQFKYQLPLAEHLAYLGVVEEMGWVTLTFEDEQGTRKEVPVWTVNGTLYNQPLEMAADAWMPGGPGPADGGLC